MTVRYPLESPHVRERARIDIGAYTPFPRTFHAHPLLRRNGRPYYIAGHVLSEILNWYQPVWEEYIDENGQTRIRAWQRFKGKALRLSYTYFANLFGLSEETIRRAVYFLRDRNLIVLETVYLQDETGRMAGRAVLVYPNWELVREIFNPMAYAVQDADVGLIDFPEADMSVEAADRYDHTGRLEASTDTEVPAERYGDTVREDEDVEETADRYSHTGRSGDTEGPKYTGRSSFSAAPKGIPNGTPKGIPNGTAVPPNKNNRDKNRQQKIDDKNKAAPLSGGEISRDKISEPSQITDPSRQQASQQTQNHPPNSERAAKKFSRPEIISSVEGNKIPDDRGAPRESPGVPGGSAAGREDAPRSVARAPTVRSGNGPPHAAPSVGTEIGPRVAATVPAEPNAHTGASASSVGRQKPNAERVLRDLGVPRKLRPRLLRALRAGDVTVEDFVAELARCYRDAAKGRVERPVVAAVASLLSDNRAPREFYDPDAWAEHLPEPVWELLFRAGWIPEDEDVEDEGGDADSPSLSWAEALASFEQEPASALPSPEPDSEAARLWKKVLQQLRLEMSPSSFNTWVHPCRAVAFDGQTLTIAAPNVYTRDWLVSRLTNGLRRKLLGILGRPVEVRFIVSPGGEE